MLVLYYIRIMSMLMDRNQESLLLSCLSIFIANRPRNRITFCNVIVYDLQPATTTVTSITSVQKLVVGTLKVGPFIEDKALFRVSCWDH